MGPEISLAALPLCGDLIIAVLISLLCRLFWLHYEARDVALVAAGSSHLCLLHAHPLATVPILYDTGLSSSPLFWGALPLPPQKEEGRTGSLRLGSPSSYSLGFDNKLNRIEVMRWQVAVF